MWQHLSHEQTRRSKMLSQCWQADCSAHGLGISADWPLVCALFAEPCVFPRAVFLLFSMCDYLRVCHWMLWHDWRPPFHVPRFTVGVDGVSTHPVTLQLHKTFMKDVEVWLKLDLWQLFLPRLFKKSTSIVISSIEIGHCPFLHSPSDQAHKHVLKVKEELRLVLKEGLVVFCFINNTVNPVFCASQDFLNSHLYCTYWNKSYSPVHRKYH